MPFTPKRRTLAESIRRAVRLGLADAHVALPARVTRVDLAKGIVDAQPLIMDVVEISDEDIRTIPFPVVTNVPIFVANGGGFRMTFPVAVGDVVTLQFADRSLDVWLARGGGPVDPIDPRVHALSDGVVAIPSVNPTAPWTIRADAVAIGKEGGPQILFKAGTIDLGGDGAGLEGVALGQTLSTFLDLVRTWLGAHTHAFVAKAGPDALVTAVTTTPVPALPVVASATVKVIP